MIPTRHLLIALLALMASASAVAAAENPPVVDPTLPPPVDTANPPAEGTEMKTGSGITPLIAPVPFKDTQIGWGVYLLVGAIHRFDPDTSLKPSTGAVGGFYSENDSWGVMAVEMARLQQDRWRVRGMYSHFDVNYDFFGIGEDAGTAGQSIPLEQKIDVVLGSVLRRVRPNTYLGASALYMNTKASARSVPPGFRVPAGDLASAQLFAPGIQAELDTRNDDYWPGSGSFANVRGNFFSEDLGSSRDFQRYMATWSWYRSLGSNDRVLATNLNGAAAAGNVPFYMFPTIGGGAYGLRGYQQGRYRDRVMITGQAELRLHTAGKLAGVVFGGFGQVAPSIGELTEARVLPAGGVGLRFQITQMYRMHMRADYAWGVDEGILYFGVSEAF